MNAPPDDLIVRLLAAVHQVQTDLGRDPFGDADTSFADMLDSMALVEYLLVVGQDLGVTVPEVEQSVERRFTTPAALARALCERGLAKRDSPALPLKPAATPAPMRRDADTCWLAATSVRLPETVQTAAHIDALLQRPPGWWESHAGIHERRLWRDQNPLTAAADAGRDCVYKAGLTLADVDVLLVTSEAPPLLVGLAAALHGALALPQTAAALEVGGACTGFVAALWLGRALLARHRVVLIVAVEAPSRLLDIGPGPSGEAAALFGDGTAACLLCRDSTGPAAVAVREVTLGADGSRRDLVQLLRTAGTLELRLDGTRLAGAAIHTMAHAIEHLAAKADIAVHDLAAVVVHGGNGRFPALLARQLDLPLDRVWSETARTGNLGSASLPVAWAAQPPPRGLVIWTTVGAGLTSGSALLQA